jgi:hypothetical protein
MNVLARRDHDRLGPKAPTGLLHESPDRLGPAELADQLGFEGLAQINASATLWP